MKRSIVFLFVGGAWFSLGAALGDGEPGSEGVGATCYVGSLDLKLKRSQARDCTLLYDGTRLSVRDGVFCFKEPNAVAPFFMLFVNPSYIVYCNDECTVSSLALRSGASYECMLLTHVARPVVDGESLFDWGITPCRLGEVSIKGKKYLQVPAHTIVIPLAGAFFEKVNGAIFFTGQPCAEDEQVIHLPAPQIKAGHGAAICKALDKADIALLNLNSIHTTRERCQICMDKHNLVQE